MRVAVIVASGIAIVLASTEGTAKPATVSQTAEFLKAVAAIRADSNNNDKFKEPVRSALDGQHFKVVLPFDTDLFASGGTNYDYKSGKLLLSLELEKASPSPPSPGEYANVLLIAEHVRSLGSYVGQNAFGATARVHSIEKEGAGFALVSTPRAEKQAETYAGTNVGTKSGWFYEQALAPGEAKALALHAAVELEGTYVKVPWGDAGFCDFGGAEATISNPTDFYRQDCYLGAKVTRIAFVNESTGAVLKEWTEASDPAVGAELWGGIHLGMDKSQVKALWPAMSDYGEIPINGQTVWVRMDDDGKVASVEMILPGDLNGRFFAAFKQKYGQPVVSKCVAETICSGKWSPSPDVSVYFSASGQVVYEASDAPPPVSFLVN